LLTQYLFPGLMLLLIGVWFSSCARCRRRCRTRSDEFRKSKARCWKRIRLSDFADVAGVEEAEEVEEMVDFLKDPAKYQNWAAKFRALG
jgi:cell division protease FtsH